VWVGELDSRVLRRIFEPKMDEVTGEWRKLNDKDLNYMCGRVSQAV
jgi:hypothetical protein